MVIRAWMLAVDSMCYNDRIWLMDRAHTNTKSSMQKFSRESKCFHNAWSQRWYTKGDDVRATGCKVCKVKESSSSYVIVPSFRLYSIL